MSPLTRNESSTSAEQIALSSFFYEVPSAPVRNRINELFLDQNDYVLPFDTERSLADIIAFLAKTKDGHDHIPAVALQQDPSGMSLDVLLAINKRTWRDGDDILRQLKEELEVVFDVLRSSQYTSNSGYESRKAIFSSIIVMCSPRVKCRLGLAAKTARKSIGAKITRKSIASLLDEAKLGIKSIDPEKLSTMGFETFSSSFVTESKNVIQLVDQWSKYQTPVRLGEVVKGVHTMKKNCKGYRNLLGLISNKDMNPCSRSSLVNMIEKVSRYWEAATKLYRIAGKVPIVRSMKIKLVKLSPEAYEGRVDSCKPPDLATCVSRLGLLNGRQYGVSQICQQLKLDEGKAYARFKRAQKSLAKAKIHAEIQIIAYCEVQSPRIFPRTVSSSKDACFLCNTFILVYGRIHTPASHGRLYAGWTLPGIPQMSALRQRFNKALTDSLRQSICTGLAQGKLSIFPGPNESTLLTLSTAESTTSKQDLDCKGSSEGVGTSASPDLLEDAGQKESDTRHHSPLLSMPSSSDIVSISDSPIRKGIAPHEGKVTCETGRQHMAPYFVTASLEVYIEPEHEIAPTLGRNSFRYTIERVAREEMPRTKCPIVNARELGDEVTCALSEERDFCLVAGEIILKISVSDVSEDQS